MVIGLDFDNTIVSYDELFHRVALEKSLIPEVLPKTKLAVREYLRRAGREDAWTEMQGYVYGARMDDAQIYPGVVEFMHLALQKGISLAIVSHKTKRPFLGAPYDLHQAARSWVMVNLVTPGLMEMRQVYFELTKADKLKRVADIDCRYFVDDLPEILAAPEFPAKTVGILFDPENHHADLSTGARFSSWHDIAQHLQGQWKKRA